jgi:nucleoid-associated protein YgaU
MRLLEETDMKINEYKKYALVLMLSAMMGACSSSPTEDGLGGEDELPKEGDLTLADAATDAVPKDMLENPEAIPPADAPAPAPEGAEAPADALQNITQDSPPAEPAASTPPVSAPPVAMSGEQEEYSVQRGDTLMKIAFEHYGDLYKWRDIYDWNRDKISSPNSISAGTVLKLEKTAEAVSIDRNGEKFLIRPGDTLGKISDEVYGTKAKWKKLWENNRQLIKDPNRIFAGFYLYYTISPEEMQERDRMKQQVSPQPLVQNQEPVAPAAPPVQTEVREPAQAAMPQQPGVVEAAPAPSN